MKMAGKLLSREHWPTEAGDLLGLQSWTPGLKILCSSLIPQYAYILESGIKVGTSALTYTLQLAFLGHFQTHFAICTKVSISLAHITTSERFSCFILSI